MLELPLFIYTKLSRELAKYIHSPLLSSLCLHAITAGLIRPLHHQSGTGSEAKTKNRKKKKTQTQVRINDCRSQQPWALKEHHTLAPVKICIYIKKHRSSNGILKKRYSMTKVVWVKQRKKTLFSLTATGHTTNSLRWRILQSNFSQNTPTKHLSLLPLWAAYVLSSLGIVLYYMHPQKQTHVIHCIQLIYDLWFWYAARCCFPFFFFVCCFWKIISHCGIFYDKLARKIARLNFITQ